MRDWEKKDYDRHAVAELVEVALLIGDVTLSPDGAPPILIYCRAQAPPGTRPHRTADTRCQRTTPAVHEK